MQPTVSWYISKEQMIGYLGVDSLLAENVIRLLCCKNRLLRCVFASVESYRNLPLLLLILDVFERRKDWKCVRWLLCSVMN